MLEHSENQQDMYSRARHPCAQMSLPLCKPRHIRMSGSTHLLCVQQRTQPKHQGWQPGQTTGRGSDASWIQPSRGFPLRGRGPACPALITALGLSRIVLSIFRLWMLPWTCVLGCRLGYCSASLQNSSSEGKPEACKRHKQRSLPKAGA